MTTLTGVVSSQRGSWKDRGNAGGVALFPEPSPRSLTRNGQNARRSTPMPKAGMQPSGILLPKRMALGRRHVDRPQVG